MIRSILFLITSISTIFMYSIFLKIFGIHINYIFLTMIMLTIIFLTYSIISLLLSKKTALQSVNGEIIYVPRNIKEKWLISAIKNQSKKMCINIPDIAIYKSLHMNAFATGFQKNNSLIAVSSGLLNNMNKGEIEAVVAHEITHITNGDMITMIVIQSIVNICVISISYSLIKYFSNIFMSYKIHREYKKIQKSFIFYFLKNILQFFIKIFSTIIVMWFSRNREFYADIGAVELVGKKKMISVLKKLKNSDIPKESNSIITLCIHGRNNIILDLLSSHPSLDKRILAIKKNTKKNKI
ncbi:protease HtpX [Buchnera aphidicola]|uniref:Heat shock protein, peptidase family M48 n=1 Tax=Buchnera aphidicola subsp. Cinara cedri (strain Cc) TaxID=372461 RepID=Q057M7_BUCCC|nr:protease HtpX [Buchnera aphidicola]ABJ90672.1 heat shock protein, peptidase family M48 [Buchnera aphidicola BCc]